MRQVRITLYAILTFCLVVVIQSCANGNKSGADENSVEGAKMEIVLYNDDTGSILDENKQRICGFELSGGRTGTITIRTSTDIDLFGTNTHRFYIKGNYAYAVFEDALKDRVENGTPVKKVEQGSEIHFYLIPGADVANISKKTERKEENKSKEREISASTNTWTGASSVDELKRKIVGTTWHCKMPREYGGFILKFVFSEGSVKKYTADPHEGKWEDGYITYSYSVEVVRDNNGNNQVVVSLSNSTNREKGFREDIAFFNKCTKVVYFRGTDIGGVGNAQPMEFGDFTWSNEL